MSAATVNPEGRGRDVPPKSLLPPRASRVLSACLLHGAFLALAIVAFWAFDWAVAYVAFPYESIDPLEGLMLEHAVRLGRGETIYPDADATAAISCPYPPLYQAACAPLVKAFGPSLLWMRLVPALATLVVAVLLVAEVRSHSGGWLVPLMWGLLWLCLNGALDAFFVRARNDMLFAALGVGALILYRRGSVSVWALVGAAVLSGLATFTKQSGVFIAAAGLGFLVIQGRWRRAAITAAILGLAMGVVTAWMQVRTDGRFLADIMPAGLYGPSTANADRLQEFAGTVGPLLAAGAVWCVYALVRNRRAFASPYALALVAFAPFGAIHHISEGGAENAHVPMLAALLLVLGTQSAALLRTRSPVVPRAVFGALVLVQLACLPVLREKPGEEDWAAGQAIDELIQHHPGPILMCRFQSYLVRAGRPVHEDFITARDRWVTGRWDPTRVVNDLKRKKYALVLTDGRLDPAPVRDALREHYRPVGRLPLPGYVRRRLPLIALVPRQ